jgi:mannan endo-1,4-beta-mannosidase
VKIGRVLGGVVVVLVILPVAAAVATARLHQHDPLPPPTQQAHRVSATSSSCPKPASSRWPLIGVATGSLNVASFVHATGVHPQLVVDYLKFGRPYSSVEACSLARSGAELLIQWDPVHVSLQQIADGRWDHYVTRFARAVRAARVPIVLSFGHEMNGWWYSWGYNHVSPKTFIAAWRRLHRLFTAAGASNVTWCWDVNHWIPALAGIAPNYNVSPPRWWWPGGQYVDWVGMDAYYETPASTFHSLFAGSLRALRKLTHKPVLIGETAAAAGSQQAGQIRTLFAGLRRTHLIGAVWFDKSERYAWRLEGHPAAIAAFRAGVRSLHPS